LRQYPHRRSFQRQAARRAGDPFRLGSPARAIVEGVRVDDDKARVLLVDSDFRVIAASDGQGQLTERVPLALNGKRNGF
jgi:hypothetical protein